MPIAIDLHTHAKVSKSLPFSMDHFDRMVRSAERIGLSGFAATEHFDAPDYWEMASHLTTRFPYEDGHLHVAPGMTVPQGPRSTSWKAVTSLPSARIDCSPAWTGVLART